MQKHSGMLRTRKGSGVWSGQSEREGVIRKVRGLMKPDSIAPCNMDFILSEMGSLSGVLSKEGF